MKISKVEALGIAIETIQVNVESLNIGEDNESTLQEWQDTQAVLYKMRAQLLKAKFERKLGRLK